MQSTSHRIVIIDGHPDPDSARYCHALAGAYAKGALQAGHQVRRISIAELDVPFLRSQCEWQTAAPPPGLVDAQNDIFWADHLVIIYPLWLGTMPALVKAFLEQVMRPGFAIETDPAKQWAKLLKGRSARVVVTMGMPAWLYWWYFRAHSLKSLERNILSFVGIGPIRSTVIGGLGAMDEPCRLRWLDKMSGFGSQAR